MTLRGSTDISATTRLETWDRPAEHGGRVVGITVDDSLDIHLHGFEGDAAIVATCNRLIGVLVGLRDAAINRQSPAFLPDGVEYVGTVGEFLGEIGA